MLVGGREYHQRLTVIRECADLLDNESPATHRLCAAADTEIGVFPQQTRVLFVDANHVLYHNRAAIVGDVGAGLGGVTSARDWSRVKVAYQIMDLTEAIAAEGELICHRAHTILPAMGTFEHATEHHEAG